MISIPHNGRELLPLTPFVVYCQRRGRLLSVEYSCRYCVGEGRRAVTTERRRKAKSDAASCERGQRGAELWQQLCIITHSTGPLPPFERDGYG